jgi:hypothetical protein
VNRVVILGYLAIAFKIWMIIDALRRRVGLVWFAVVMVPFGEWLYFIAVKLRDFNVRPAPPPEQSAALDLERLRAEAEESPSFHNRTRLAWALLGQGEAEEARALFERALSSHPADSEGLYGLGLCQLELGDHAAAADILSGLVEHSMGYEDYHAALALCEALFALGRRDEAFGLLRGVIRSSHRIEHQVALAKYELRAEQPDQAQNTLRKALDEFEGLPDYLRRRNGAFATEARRLLRGLDEQNS